MSMVYQTLSQMKYFEKVNIEYNFRNYRELASHRKLTSRYGLEWVNYKASQVWYNVSMENKNSSSLKIFKSNNQIMDCQQITHVG